MSFFQQIGKKLSDAGKGVSEQTKNVIEVSKLNLSVAEEDKRIEELFSTLGKMYFEKFKDDEQAENHDIIEQIHEGYELIAQYQERINQIKGVTKCENCGAELERNVQFCSACGAKIEHPVCEEPAEQEETTEE